VVRVDERHRPPASDEDDLTPVKQQLGEDADDLTAMRHLLREAGFAPVADTGDERLEAVMCRHQQIAMVLSAIKARFGCTAPVGTTDDGRLRRLTVHLPPGVREPSLRRPAAGGQRPAVA
jgi:hypothetical protein